MATYSNVTNNLLMSCENSLGVYTTFEGETLELLPIEEFCIKYSKLIKTAKFTNEDHLACGEYLTSLSYLNSICNYNRISVLDFNTHRCVDTLANFLIPFGKKEYLSKKTLKSVTSVVKYLLILENQSVEIVKSMSYRYVRLFISLMWRHDYTHASIVARFILDQIFLSSNLDKSIKLKIKELKKAEKRVEKITRNDFEESPGKIESIKNSVNELVNKAQNLVEDSLDKVDEIVGTGDGKLKEIIKPSKEEQDESSEEVVKKPVDEKLAIDSERIDKLKKLAEKARKKKELGNSSSFKEGGD